MPSGTSRSSPSTAVIGPKRLTTPLSSIAAIGADAFRRRRPVAARVRARSGGRGEALGQPEVAEPVALLAALAADDDPLRRRPRPRPASSESSWARLASAAAIASGASSAGRTRPSRDFAANSGSGRSHRHLAAAAHLAAAEAHRHRPPVSLAAQRPAPPWIFGPIRGVHRVAHLDARPSAARVTSSPSGVIARSASCRSPGPARRRGRARGRSRRAPRSRSAGRRSAAARTIRAGRSPAR